MSKYKISKHLILIKRREEIREKMELTKLFSCINKNNSLHIYIYIMGKNSLGHGRGDAPLVGWRRQFSLLRWLWGRILRCQLYAIMIWKMSPQCRSSRDLYYSTYIYALCTYVDKILLQVELIELSGKKIRRATSEYCK